MPDWRLTIQNWHSVRAKAQTTVRRLSTFRSASKHVTLGFELAPELAQGLCQGQQSSRQLGAEAGLHATDPQAIEGLSQFMLTLFNAAQAKPGLINLSAVRVAMVDTLIEQVSRHDHIPCQPRPGSTHHHRSKTTCTNHRAPHTKLMSSDAATSLTRCAAYQRLKRTSSGKLFSR